MNSSKKLLPNGFLLQIGKDSYVATTEDGKDTTRPLYLESFTKNNIFFPKMLISVPIYELSAIATVIKCFDNDSIISSSIVRSKFTNDRYFYCIRKMPYEIFLIDGNCFDTIYFDELCDDNAFVYQTSIRTATYQQALHYAISQ